MRQYFFAGAFRGAHFVGPFVQCPLLLDALHRPITESQKKTGHSVSKPVHEFNIDVSKKLHFEARDEVCDLAAAELEAGRAEMQA